MRTPVHMLLIILLAATAANAASPHGKETTQQTFTSAQTGTAVAPAINDPVAYATRLVQEDRPLEALEVLELHRPARAELSPYHAAYARSLIKSERPYASIEHYRLAYLYAATPVEKEHLLLERAVVYKAMQYDAEAAVCFSVFLKQFPKSNARGLAELGIADARFRLGEYRDALLHYERAGTSFRARAGKANSLQALGRTAEAHTIYRSLLDSSMELVNASGETLYGLGENFRLSGRKNESRVYLSAVRGEPFQSRASMSLGQIALDDKRYEDALKHFSNAEQSSDRVVRRDAVLKRAETQLELKNTDEALAALLEIRTRYPYGRTYDAAMHLLTRLYRSEGKFTEAAVVIKSLLYRRKPDLSALDEFQAIILEARDKHPEAFQTLWRESGRWLMDQQRTRALVEIARGLRYTGKPLIDLCAWLIKYGDDAVRSEARLLLADFYLTMNEPVTAWGYIQRARVKKDSDTVLRIKARAYLASQEPRKAGEALIAIRDPREEDLLLLIDALPPVRKDDKAVEHCKRILDKGAWSSVVHARFADVLYNADRKQESLAYYRKAAAAKPAQDTKPGKGPSPDAEWAHYRVAMLGKGGEVAGALSAIKESKSQVGKTAAADLRGLALHKERR